MQPQLLHSVQNLDALFEGKNETKGNGEHEDTLVIDGRGTIRTVNTKGCKALINGNDDLDNEV